MYKIGDYVVKSTDGVCRVEDILHPEMAIADPDSLYYLLKPLDNSRSTLYVATDMAEKQGVRAVMDEEHAWDVIKKIPEIHDEWIKNDREREEVFRKILKSYDSYRLVGMIKNLYIKKLERLALGKKNTSTEEKFLNNAENLLYSELSFVIGKEKSEMLEMVRESIEK